jgi:hypothetical protein
LAAKPLFLPNYLVFLEDLTGKTSRASTNNHVLAKIKCPQSCLEDFGPIAGRYEKTVYGAKTIRPSRPGPEPGSTIAR